MTASPAAAWLAATRAQADQPPASPRQPLWLADGQACIGSVEPALAARVCTAGFPLHHVDGAWVISGAPDESLVGIAHWLRAAKLSNGWRDELLAVTDETGRWLASIERAVVRPLGIATHAVHLLATAEDGGVWVQQRAFDKATDPGLWDTTMGGLQAAGESVTVTLARETWEEAGLRLAQLRGVQQVERCRVRRPLPHGYMVEHIACFEGVLPAGTVPVNQDGEVERFECWPVDQLQQRLIGGAFTLEAAVVLGAWLERHGGI